MRIQLQLYVDGYVSNIDESYETEISLDVILDQMDVMEERKVLFTGISLDIQDTISKVSDIVSISSPDGGEVEDGYDTGKAFLEKLGEDIQTYEDERMVQDFIILESMMGSAKGLIEAFSGKGDISVGSYKAGEAFQKEEMKQAIALMMVHEKYYEERIIEYEAARARYDIRVSIQERITEGKVEILTSTALAGGSIAVAKMAAILVNPVAGIACIALASLGTMFAISTGTEGVQNVIYGLSWDNKSIAFNPVRDTLFAGNQASYGAAEEALMISMGLLLWGGVGVQYGVKAMLTEIAKDTISAGAGTAAGKIAAENGADEFEQMLVGISAGVVTRIGIEGIESILTADGKVSEDKVKKITEEANKKIKELGEENTHGSWAKSTPKPGDPDFVGPLPNEARKFTGEYQVTENLKNHIENVDTTVPRKRGIGGAHNKEVFLQNDVKVVNEIPNPKINGVSSIEYQMPKCDKTGTPIHGEYQTGTPKVKTVYNPEVISTGEYLERGLEAVNNAASEYPNGVLPHEWTGTDNQGVTWRGYSENGEIISFFSE